jgi:GNAT superfamily N-acetyltransferase
LSASLPSPRSVAYSPSIHDVNSFDCGNESLNTWLIRDAHHARLMGTANTYVFARDSHVIAYYSLSAHQLQSDELPTRLAHGAPLAIPAYLIGKLAVTKEVQNQMIGGSLLIDALLRLCRASEGGPSARIITVDAIDDAAINFYRKNHFVSSPTDQKQMFMKMSTARKIVTRG